jgi:hypothetical protein
VVAAAPQSATTSAPSDSAPTWSVFEKLERLMHGHLIIQPGPAHIP